MPNTYITIQKTLTRLGSQVYRLLGVASDTDLTAEPSSLDAEDDAAQIAAIEALTLAVYTANDMIENRLRDRVSLPLPGDPESASWYPELTMHGASIVLWNLLQGREDVQREEDRQRFSDADKFLRLFTTNSGVTLATAEPDNGSGTSGAAIVEIGSSAEQATKLMQPCIKAGY